MGGADAEGHRLCSRSAAVPLRQRAGALVVGWASREFAADPSRAASARRLVHVSRWGWNCSGDPGWRGPQPQPRWGENGDEGEREAGVSQEVAGCRQ
jgi:hypothetical protein